MKIYLIPVNIKYQTPSKISAFPPHSKGFNIETGFLSYLHGSDKLTKNPNEADWHYLPIIWSYWQLSNNYGRENRDEMQKYLDKTIIDDTKTFTVSEADDEPGFEIGNTTVFSANSGDKWICTPIITLPHLLPSVLPKKKYLSNFVGNVHPWKTRIEMVEILKDHKDIKIIQSKKGEDLFVNTILESYSTLCPRGSAQSSYRFYESMQLGTVPIMIADYEFRPFPDRIDWQSCSYYFDSPERLPDFFGSVSKKELELKSQNARSVWSKLFDEWPEYILDNLSKK